MRIESARGQPATPRPRLGGPRVRTRRSWCGALLLAAWAAQPLAATEGVDWLAPPGTSEWADQTFGRIRRHTRYEVVATRTGSDRESEPAYLATSDCAASGKVLPVSNVDLLRTPILRWSWKIVRGLDIADERSQKGDDFAARVYVLFAFDPEAASLPGRLAHRLYSNLFRRPLPGSALDYVFASHLPAGTSWPNPSQASAKMIALRTGSLGAARPLTSHEGWYHESVDVLADHARFIGPDHAPEIVAVAIMTDTDASCARAEALYASFRFAERPLAQEGGSGAEGGSGTMRDPL